ncbi:MAG: hypothetical protein ACKO0Z_15995, partial [Betaproteobacteria bacterium]
YSNCHTAVIGELTPTPPSESLITTRYTVPATINELEIVERIPDAFVVNAEAVVIGAKSLSRTITALIPVALVSFVPVLFTRASVSEILPTDNAVKLTVVESAVDLSLNQNVKC